MDKENTVYGNFEYLNRILMMKSIKFKEFTAKFNNECSEVIIKNNKDDEKLEINILSIDNDFKKDKINDFTDIIIEAIKSSYRQLPKFTEQPSYDDELNEKINIIENHRSELSLWFAININTINILNTTYQEAAAFSKKEADKAVKSSLR